MFDGLVISGLEMSGLGLSGFMRSCCDMLGHYLFLVMVKFLDFHVLPVIYAGVVLVVVVLGLGIGHRMSIIMGVRMVEGMEDSVEPLWKSMIMEWNRLHIMLIVILMIKFRVSDMGLRILDIMILLLRDEGFAMLDLVMEIRWLLVNYRVIHWSFMVSLSLSLSMLLRGGLLRMSLLVTFFHFFFEELVVCFR